MAVIVEDGTGVTNSDSYVTRADYISYAAKVGVTIADAAAADVELIKAAEYIGRHEANLKGYRVNRDQSMAWPRYGVIIDEWSWTETEIPRQLILCQMAFALDVHNGIDLYNRPQNSGLVAKSKRVEGAVEVVYAVSDNNGQKLSQTSTGDALLASLLKNNGLMSVGLIRA